MWRHMMSHGVWYLHVQSFSEILLLDTKFKDSLQSKREGDGPITTLSAQLSRWLHILLSLSWRTPSQAVCSGFSFTALEQNWWDEIRIGLEARGLPRYQWISLNLMVCAFTAENWGWVTYHLVVGWGVAEAAMSFSEDIKCVLSRILLTAHKYHCVWGCECVRVWVCEGVSMWGWGNNETGCFPLSFNVPCMTYSMS